MSDDASLEKATSGAGSVAACTLRKGLLWQQRDKIFSRWKERFFVLTPDYLNCFKRGTSRMSEMGEFLFKVRRVERWMEHFLFNHPSISYHLNGSD